MSTLARHLSDRRALARYAAPALRGRALWRLALGLALLLAGLLAGGLALGGLYVSLGLAPQDFRALLLMREPQHVLLGLGTFVIWWPALWLTLRLVHGRGIGGVLGPAGRIRWRRYFAGVGFALGAGAATVLAAALIFGPPRLAAVAPGPWALWALGALPLLFIQTAAEEAVFRGYLLQQLAARFASPWAWAVLPSVLFGALHWNPAGYGAGALIVLAVTGLTGFALAVVTARTGDLSAAMGLHFGLNLAALILVAPEGYASGLALFRWTGGTGTMTGMILLDLASVIVAMGVAALWFRPRPAAG